MLGWFLVALIIF